MEEQSKKNLAEEISQELNDFPDLGIKIQPAKNLSEGIFIVLISVLIWIILGILQSILWKMLVGTSGYTSGILPGAIIGLLVGSITACWGKDIGMLTGAVIGVLLNFFCVATLKNPLPVDKEIFGLMVRVPLFVTVPGGIFASATAFISFYLKDIFIADKKNNNKV